jgi:acetyl-CoA carboxylase carboxyl transferase subunit alpha
LRLTAEELKRLGVIDEIVPEPEPWKVPGDDKQEQRAYDAICGDLKRSLIRGVNELSKLEPKALLDHRYQKFRKMGEWV